MKKAVSVYLDDDQIDFLKKLSKEYHVSISHVILCSLNQCLNWEYIRSSDFEKKFGEL